MPKLNELILEILAVVYVSVCVCVYVGVRAYRQDTGYEVPMLGPPPFYDEISDLPSASATVGAYPCEI